jgi:hypothetical protein
MENILALMARNPTAHLSVRPTHIAHKMNPAYKWRAEMTFGLKGREVKYGPSADVAVARLDAALAP